MYFWNREKTSAFLSEVLKLCEALDINTVAGPVMSGAVMASAIATAALLADKPVRALLLGKAGGKYIPAKHPGDLKHLCVFTTPDTMRVMILDDVVSTGSAMLHAIGEVQKAYPNALIIAAVSGNGWYDEPKNRVKKLLSKIRLFGVYGHRIEEYGG